MVSTQSSSQSFSQSSSQWCKRVYGKWILSGEHAVLRGARALVFPLESCYLDFMYQMRETKGLNLHIDGDNAPEFELILKSVLEKVMLQWLGLDPKALKGDLKIFSKIKLGAGMGASATLAVGLTYFLESLGYFDDQFKKLNNSIAQNFYQDLVLNHTNLDRMGFLFLFAKKIEDLFHGESSGVDVAVALYGKPLLYTRNLNQLNEKINLMNQFQVIDDNKMSDFMPSIFVSYSGQSGLTKDSIQIVKKLLENYPNEFRVVDQTMNECSENFYQLIINKNTNVFDWVETLNRAQSCFEKWNLMTDQIRFHMTDLKKSGALACKITGSGLGGYVISLWSQSPSDDVQKKLNLIPVFLN